MSEDWPGDELRLHLALRRLQAGDLDAADLICREILRDDRGNLNARLILGRVAFDRGEFAEAEACYRHCIKISPSSAQSHLNLGRVRFAQGRLRDAMVHFERALKLKPGAPGILVAKAEVLLAQGRYDRVLTLLKPEVKAHRDTPEIAQIVAAGELRRGNAERAIEVAVRHFDQVELPPLDRYRLGSIIGKAYEHLGDYPRAFEAYRKGNDAIAEPFDLDRAVGEIDAVIDSFSSDAIRRLPHATERSALPVFIVGMPRCGSTLVEQIIDAHPKAHGAGEMISVRNVLRQLRRSIGSNRPYPASIGDVTAEIVDELGAALIEQFRAEHRSAERILDKNLLNYMHLGALCLLAPGARIIHCVRDPLDTCLSCYAEMLDVASHPYTTDLESLGALYRHHERLMHHWRNAIDLPMLNVQYEELIDDPEAQSRRLIEFCGLDWDDRSLRPHESKRPIMTLSHDQVRKPIYRSSIGRAERFGSLLDPLRAALDRTA